ncbi:MAG: tetratricopeptide repeat protein [Phycisphaerales bacterium]|nr:tetratricopeptide repeat protein [Phycisphaerales bacterium]
MRIRACVILAAFVALVSGCQTGGAKRNSERPPLYEGMGSHHRAIATRSAMAQRYFDQGLVWMYAFNHDEAIRAFEEALRLDPQCAMAAWGVAVCLGPHINNPILPPDRAAEAWQAVRRAGGLRRFARPAEQMLIDAVAQRYADPPPQDRSPLDKAYATAMREVWRKNPDDADIATLYAESLMDLQPWDLWTHDGKPKGATEEIVAVIERALEMNPNHPGALHLYIHAVEASYSPGRAAEAADRLRNLVPAAGHLVHMPSHIDVRIGRWRQAAEANERAIVADEKYRKIAPNQGFYRVYMAHNRHFLAFTGMMEGRSAAAIKAAREMLGSVPAEFVQQNAALVDPYTPIAIEALMRFGKWDDLLKEPAPPEILPITTAFWRFARAVSHAAKGDVAAAEREQAEFRAAVKRVPDGAMMAINPAEKVLRIADHMLEGEIAFRRGEIDKAVGQLRDAVAIEDDLQYMEPPDWVQPVRHTLGAVLVSADRFAEAEQVYREDLKRWPNNGWSLLGMSKSLAGQGKQAESAEAKRQFDVSWQRSDQSIGTSCVCIAPKE